MKLDEDAFAKNHDYLLKKFFDGLQSEVKTNRQLRTIRMLRLRSQRRQVTRLIYNLSNPTDTRIWSEKQNRDEVLNRILQGHISAAQTDASEETLNEHNVFDSEEDEDDNNDEDYSTDEDDNDHMAAEELASLVKFLTTGPAFQQLRVYLNFLVNPGSALQEAIQCRNVDILRKLLIEQFKRLAVGDFAWIRELDSAGYSREEIADLLFEESTDSPWIYFEPRPMDDSDGSYDPDFHAEGCVHSYFNAPNTRDNPVLGTDLVFDDDDLAEELQELCGLAGVVPTSRDKDTWNGSIEFLDEDSVAEVSYSGLRRDNNGARTVVEKAFNVLQRLSVAFGRLQSAGHCCNAFTILVRQDSPSSHWAKELNPVELHHFDFKLVLPLLKDLRALASERFITIVKVKQAQSNAAGFLRPFRTYRFPPPDGLTVHGTLHQIALAVQLLSLGFLSYNQAHMGPLRPFYVDTAQKKVSLLGAYQAEAKESRIVAELTQLTCVGDMLQAPVITFSALRPQSGLVANTAAHRYDVRATAGDLLDTWGPGNFIAPVNGLEPFAIRVCGGVIYRVDGPDFRFHWSRSVNVDHLAKTPIDLQRVMRIGTLVTVNPRCQIDEEKSWNSSCSALEYLEVQDDFWKHDETHMGGQAGQYVLLQYNRTKHKIPGRSVKQLVVEQNSGMVIHILNCLWGLQVSFCTGVTRRVPLRLLLADLLPVFADAFSNMKYDWNQLDSQYRIIEAFQADAVQEWLATLPSDISAHILSLSQRILNTLKPTGIDPTGNSLMVAWPHNRPPFCCFRIPCNNKPSSWIRVLADSGDCATFAYITTSCLETNNIRCRGPSPLWHNTTPLLETSVLRHNENPSRPLGPLEHKRTYFFKKGDDLLQVNVERREVVGQVSLFVQPSNIPARFRQRVQRIEMLKQRPSRIRERREGREPGAEQVAILTKSEGF